MWMLTGCSKVEVLNALIPSGPYRLFDNIAYGALQRQVLSVYVPKHDSGQIQHLNKVVIFFYGGGWDSGHRAEYKFVAEALTAAGYTTVIPDYRVYPESVFPDFLHDSALAVKWVHDHIHLYQGDATQLYLMGHSAGAHIAVMLGVNGDYLKAVSLTPQHLSGVIGLAGPYDFLPLQSKRLKEIFGPKQNRWVSQPIHFVDGRNPPILLAVGQQDKTVLPFNTAHMANKILQKQGAVEVATFNDYDHVDMVAKLAKPLRGDGKLYRTVLDFLARR